MPELEIRVHVGGKTRWMNDPAKTLCRLVCYIFINIINHIHLEKYIYILIFRRIL